MQQHQKLNFGLSNDEQIFSLLHCSSAPKHSNVRNCYLKDRLGPWGGGRERLRLSAQVNQTCEDFFTLLSVWRRKKINNKKKSNTHKHSWNLNEMRILVLPINMVGYNSARTGLLRKLHTFQITNESYINRFPFFHIELTLHCTSTAYGLC